MDVEVGWGFEVVRVEKPPPADEEDDGLVLLVVVAAVRCLLRVAKMRWCLAMPRAMRLKIWLASGATGSLGLGSSGILAFGGLGLV